MDESDFKYFFFNRRKQVMVALTGAKLKLLQWKSKLLLQALTVNMYLLSIVNYTFQIGIMSS